jgi:glycosyltransferase involved in cell wall biosynthesis
MPNSDGVTSPPATAAPLRLVALSHTSLVSGAEAVLLRVLHATADEGWEVACLAPPGAFAEVLDAEGIRRGSTPDLKLPAGPRVLGVAVVLARSLVAARRLRRAAAGADLVLVNSILALPGLRFARLRVPAAWLVHDVIHRRDWLAYLRVFGGGVGEAIAVSEAAARPVRNAGIRVRVVRHGIRWPVEPAPAARDGVPVVGCTALLTSWKGQDVLLEAVARMRRRDVRVELVGGSFPKDAGYVESLRARAAQPDLAGRVSFVGHVDDVLARVRTWAVGVSASVDPEAGPLSVLEYMSVGVPAVATAHGGSGEIVDGAGLLVPPGDPSALAEAIERLLEDPTLYRRCAEAGPRAVAEGGFTVERFRRSVVLALREIAAR